MRYAVIYSSNTGNTKKLAEVIAQELPKEDVVYFGEVNEAAKQADMIFAGFWTDKGCCSQDMMDFLGNLHGSCFTLSLSVDYCRAQYPNRCGKGL